MRSLIYLCLIVASFGGFAQTRSSSLTDTMWSAWGRVSCVDDRDKEVSIASLSDVLQGLVNNSKLHETVKTVDGSHEALVLKFDNQDLTTLVLFSGWETNEPLNAVDNTVMTRVETKSTYALAKDGTISTHYIKSRAISRMPNFMHGDITQWWDFLDKQLKSSAFTISPQTDLVGQMISRMQVADRSQYGLDLKLKFDDSNPHDAVYSQVCMPGTNSKALVFSFSATTDEQMKQQNIDR